MKQSYFFQFWHLETNLEVCALQIDGKTGKVSGYLPVGYGPGLISIKL